MHTSWQTDEANKKICNEMSLKCSITMLSTEISTHVKAGILAGSGKISNMLKKFNNLLCISIAFSAL